MLRVPQHERKNINNISFHSVRPERRRRTPRGFFSKLLGRLFFISWRLGKPPARLRLAHQVKRVKDLGKPLVLFRRRGVPEGRHGEINGVVLVKRESMNAGHNDGFALFHRMKRRKIKLESNVIGQVTALANLHVQRFDVC
jgi:hypothetical protein